MVPLNPLAGWVRRREGREETLKETGTGIGGGVEGANSGAWKRDGSQAKRLRNYFKQRGLELITRKTRYTKDKTAEDPFGRGRGKGRRGKGFTLKWVRSCVLR